MLNAVSELIQQACNVVLTNDFRLSIQITLYEYDAALNHVTH